MPKVLVIDDDQEFRETIREVLESEGCEVQTAGAVYEALVALATGARPDLVLLDVRLGAHDMPMIAALRGAARVPLVAITGLPPSRVPRDLPVEAVLFKPFTIYELRRHLPLPRAESRAGAPGELFR